MSLPVFVRDGEKSGGAVLLEDNFQPAPPSSDIRTRRRRVGVALVLLFLLLTYYSPLRLKACNFGHRFKGTLNDHLIPLTGIIASWSC